MLFSKTKTAPPFPHYEFADRLDKLIADAMSAGMSAFQIEIVLEQRANPCGNGKPQRILRRRERLAAISDERSFSSAVLIGRAPASSTPTPLDGAA
jgi:hypothetical protein